ncbi:autotransporter outer membrane beta-barrel domain-containing protein [Polynucleobacter sp. MWH-Spelu-300-X4]|uniref:autotransporter outer membrane beta-barrel domain-containing protein n=1 Tax=Polynucleobacter sp. MWH-Spelu-300-X4 TaxID=2689109 RepID=UPI001BFCE003|nr:autotransporter outer membrane beta-barrel domain-containing protein [Polynucleobacter sp. MWH-Spelu-300-X4]QWD79545.1 autotransporter outer membrane beta-barrel domain-containing protein [Polynucleobacter sp. MWH-Spelu-300-X4]
MKLKNIALASALVAGSMFTVQVVAATYYSSATGYSFPTNNNTYLSTTSTVPSGGSYLLSFNSSAAVAQGASVFMFNMNGSMAFMVAGWTTNQSVSVGSNTWAFTASSAFNSFSFNPGSGAPTLSNIILCDAADACSTSNINSSSSVDLTPNAYALRSVYNVQSAALNAGLSYDCNVFDKEGVCLSTGGRYSVTNSPETTTTSGLLIGSYKYDKNIRLGAWVDQNLSVKNVDGIKLSNSQPLFGAFGVWSERNDGLGYEVKVSAGYGDKDVTVTRTSTNEGSSKVQSRGLQTVSSYGIAIDGDWIAAPYVGVKYTSLKRGSYVEGGSSPLTYDTLRQETTAALAGVKFTGKIDPQTFAVVSAGVEQDLNTNNSQYSAGSNATVFNANPQKTRPVVSAGVYYDLDKTQRLGVNATVRQEAFESTSSTSVLATYTVGF